MDPFDPAAVDPAAPGFLGQSLDFWRSMMQLGGNMSQAANARTGGGFLANGTGFAGPLGAATSATAQQMQELARTRSAVGLQNATAQSVQMQNLLTQIKMPAAAAQAQIQQRLLTDPQFRQQFMSQFGIGGGDGSAQGGAPQPGAPQGQAAADGAIPPDQRGPMVAEAVKGTPLPVDLVHGLVGYESGWNPAAANKDSGAFGLGGILPSTARNPGFGMQPLPANATPQQQLKFSVDYLHARGKAAGIQDADWTNPAKVTAALAAYHGPTTDANGVDGSQYASNVQGRMKLASNGPIPMSGPAQAAAPQPSAQQPGGAPMAQGGGPMQASPPMAQGSPGGGPPPQTTQPDPAAMARADAYEKQANGIEMMRGFGVPAPGDPAALRQAAQQWRQFALAGATAGAQKAAQLPYTVNEVRPGGGLFVGGKAVASVPLRSDEVVQSGPNAGMRIQVFREPFQGQPVSSGASSPAGSNLPPGAVATHLSPLQEEFLTTRGKELGDQFKKIDTDAEAATESNYLFDNLRNDSQSWQMGRFADFEGDARAWLSATAHTFGITPTGLDQKLADFQAFNKSSGMLLRSAVHETSSRAAVQEYNLIGQTLPQPTTSTQGFGQIADQWQGLNDFRLARQKFARGFTGNPQDFNVEFNSKVSPSAFLLNRMSQTPQGKQDMQTMLARMQTTPEGRLTAGRLLQKYQYAKQGGLFNNLPPMGGEAPPPDGQQ